MTKSVTDMDGLVSFLCNVCGALLKSKRNAVRHCQHKHLGVKFYCPYCEYSVGRKDQVTRHVKIHHASLYDLGKKATT